MKNQERGITLIALIITIIVMLILVGVTINIALNGGIFQKAKSAADGTQKQVEKEELMSAAFGTVNSKGDLNVTKNSLENNLSNGWVVDNTTITDGNNQIWYKCTSPKGNIYYLNTATGEIMEIEPAGSFSWSTFGLDGVKTTNNDKYILSIPDGPEFEMTFSATGVLKISSGGNNLETLDLTDETTLNNLTSRNPLIFLSDYFGSSTVTLDSEDTDIIHTTTDGGTVPAGNYDYERNLGYLERRMKPSPNVTFGAEYVSTDYTDPTGTDITISTIVVTKDDFIWHVNNSLAVGVDESFINMVDGLVDQGALTLQQEQDMLKTGNNMVGFVENTSGYSWLAVFTEEENIKLYFKWYRYTNLLDIIDEDDLNLIGTFNINS